MRGFSEQCATPLQIVDRRESVAHGPLLFGGSWPGFGLPGAGDIAPSHSLTPTTGRPIGRTDRSDLD